MHFFYVCLDFLFQYLPITFFVRSDAFDVSAFLKEGNVVLNGGLAQSQFHHETRSSDARVVSNQFKHLPLGLIERIPHFIPHFWLMDEIKRDGDTNRIFLDGNDIFSIERGDFRNPSFVDDIGKIFLVIAHIQFQLSTKWRQLNY